MATRHEAGGAAGLGIGAGLLRRAAALMDQQMWCFGRDIRLAEGNALIRFGFERSRPPADVVGASAYALARPGGVRVTLWGFGLCCAGDPGDGLLYLGRFHFEPTWRPEPVLPGPAWDSTRLPRFRAPEGDAEWARARRLTTAALDFLADYEAWADATLGRGHRQSCVESWTKTRVAAGRIAPTWRSLARRVGRAA